MADTLDQIKALLDRERNALLQGDHNKLSEITDELEAAFSGLSMDALTEDDDKKRLLNIKDIAKRNAQLFDAAKMGILTARDKLTLIKRACSELNTYTVDGDMKDVIVGTSSVEKRA